MLGFLDNFRQTFHNFQTRRGTFPWAVHCPIGVSASATGLRRRAGNIFCGFRRLLAATVRPWSKKVAVAWLYSSLGNQSETKRLLFRVEIVSLDFEHELLYIWFCCLLRHHCHAGAWRRLYCLKCLSLEILQAIVHLQNLNYE
jgi:hypothetical protein